jgi:protein disulfide-isomerase
LKKLTYFRKTLLIPVVLITTMVLMSASEKKQVKRIAMQTSETKKLKVEIWSDIMCPFCYIGKRNFEAAMAKFQHAAHIEVEWKSFQLDPGIPMGKVQTKSVYEYLADRKGISLEESKEMHQQVVEMAEKAGLKYNFDKAVVANSLLAHRVIQMAKTKGLGDQAEERFFLAYFTQGKDMSDTATLMELGKDIGLKESEVNEALTNDVYAYKITQDIQESGPLGLRGVPYFVLDRKFAISGAQPVSVFTSTLERAYGDWIKANPQVLQVTGDGPVCDPKTKACE